MSRPREKMVEDDEVRPCRSARQPLYLQDYEVSYPQRHLTFTDEQVNAVTNAEVLSCICEMREESKQLRQEVVYPESDLLSRKRWRHSQILSDHFWKHFVHDFLPSLQTRQKWNRERENISVATVVLIVDEQLPRALWRVGTVSSIIPSSDGRQHLQQTDDPQPGHGQHTCHEPNDQLFDMLVKCQGSRLDDQRFALPPPSSRGPTVPVKTSSASSCNCRPRG
ncbi:hypothetical protein QQF64_015488 [Cirrhinus molitorella]|uniref:DUF5641 domain-containing protein n=1 Tax=Cirrhinus molitorella TaxID=172907 RepID=A0ABR3NV43_9TELE